MKTRDYTYSTPCYFPGCTLLSHGLDQPHSLESAGIKAGIAAPEAADVLSVAYGLIRGERAKDYGDPKLNVAAIASAWNAYLLSKIRMRDKGNLLQRVWHRVFGTDDLINAHDVCMLMVLLKVLRTTNGYHHDTTIDIAGYAALDEVVGA